MMQRNVEAGHKSCTGATFAPKAPRYPHPSERGVRRPLIMALEFFGGVVMSDKDEKSKPGLAEKIYEDECKEILKDASLELRPAGKEIGRTLQRAIVIALMPMKVAIWGYEQVERFILEKLPQKLAATLPENIVQPKAMIAGPTINYLRYYPEEPQLADLFLNLLASALDRDKFMDVHPAFPEIIRQMTSDEAKIIKEIFKERAIPFLRVNAYFKENEFTTVTRCFSDIGYRANCAIPGNTQEYFDNLVRLGLLEINLDTYLIGDNLYKSLEEHKVLMDISQNIITQGSLPKFQKGIINLTNFGILFCKACVKKD